MKNNKKTIIGIIILTTLIIIFMGFFNFWKPKNSNYVTEKSFENNCKKQMQMSPMTLKQLRNLKVTEDKELKLEYFFYTNTNEKAELLAKELEKQNYKVEYGVSIGDKKLFIVTGRTTNIIMKEEIVTKWTKEMCEIGYKFDCEFDGWGTEPNQD
jgi:regulator of RNase E activity RraB